MGKKLKLDTPDAEAFDVRDISQKQFEGVNATLTVMKVSPEKFWEARHFHHDQMVRSAEGYKNMSSEKRQALVRVVKRAIAGMHDQVEDWIPDALRFDEAGEALRVEFNILAADIDEEVRLLEEVTSFELAEAARHTEQSLKELEELHGTEPSVITCSCGTESARSANFCSECGAALAEVAQPS